MRRIAIVLAACGGATPPITNHVVERKQPPDTHGAGIRIDISVPDPNPAPSLDQQVASTIQPLSSTRTYDNVVVAVASKESYLVVTLAGAVHEDRTMVDDGVATRVHEDRSDEAARTIAFMIPDGLALDVYPGQHLHGTIAITTDSFATFTTADLADDVAPVFQFDPPSTPFERGPVVGVPSGDADLERHTVTATLPYEKQARQLYGWSAHHLRNFDFEIYGFAIAMKPGVPRATVQQTVIFQLVRQPN